METKRVKSSKESLKKHNKIAQGIIISACTLLIILSWHANNKWNCRA